MKHEPEDGEIIMKEEAEENETFLYFTCSVNMHKKNLLYYVQDAETVSIGRLDNHRLEFISHSQQWLGPLTAMVPTANAHIWGVIYRISKKNMHLLDIENKMDHKKYYTFYVNIDTPHMGSFYCRAYNQKILPLPRGDNDQIPLERWPSQHYISVLIKGAIESGLPEYYINQLHKIKDNGDKGCVGMLKLLLRYGSGKRCCDCIQPPPIRRKELKLQVNKIGKYNSIANLIKRVHD